MYRIFSLGLSGRLYQLCSQGWVKTEGTSFMSLTSVRDFISDNFLPQLPDGSAMVDSYIARVDGCGTILSTYTYLKEDSNV